MKKILTLIIIISLGYLGYTWYKASEFKGEVRNFEITTQGERQQNIVDVNEIGTLMDGNYKVQKSETVLNWKGRTALKSHYGTINLSKGDLTIANTDIKGNIIFDMNTIKSEVGESLDGHLKNADFFDTEKYPTATLIIDRYSEGKIFGELTIKGITNPVELPVLLGVQDETVYINGSFEIDRTQWGIEYSSESVFSGLGDKAIYDNIEIDIALEAKKNG